MYHEEREALREPSLQLRAQRHEEREALRQYNLQLRAHAEDVRRDAAMLRARWTEERRIVARALRSR